MVNGKLTLLDTKALVNENTFYQVAASGERNQVASFQFPLN